MRTTGFLKAFRLLTKPYWMSEKRGTGLTNTFAYTIFARTMQVVVACA